MTIDIRAQAESVDSTADLARVLRELRQRLARRGSPLSYRQIAASTGMSSGAVGIYLTGARLPSEERFTALVEVLGADPTERAALTSAWRRLTAAAAVAASPPDGMQLPRALPAQPAGFTGRGEQLTQMDELVNAETRPARFAAVIGMAGVGKTALALHWAHRVTPHFPDGQLYVDLHTYSSGPRLSTMDSLAVLLSTLGADLDGLPDLTTRSLRYQTLLRGRSMVVVLDNVGSVDQVVHLLPPPPCVAVVTSRDELADFDDAVQVRRIELGGLSEGETMDLLRLLVGSRVDREPKAARALAERCAFLPLALRIAAEQAAARPQTSLAELVEELECDAGGLDEFEVPGDPRADLSSVFSWSLLRLATPLQRAFHLLGLVPGFDFDRYGLAALAGVDLEEADGLAGGLVAAHLLESRDAGRFAMHDLLRVYARASAQRDLDADDRQAAMTRLLDYYLSAVVAATDTAHPTERPTPGAVRSLSATVVAVPDLGGLATAVAWLKAERANIVAAAVEASRHGRPRYTLAIALRIWIFLEQAHSDDAIAFHTAALAAADELGDAAGPADRAKLLGALALSHYRLGEFDEATARAEESIAVLHRAGHKQGGTLGRYILASVRSAQGRYLEVLAIFEQILDFARVNGPGAQVIPLVNLGTANLTLERYETAADCFRQAADIAAAEQLDHHVVEARRGMAMVLVRLERFAEGLPMAEEAVEVTREYGYPDRLVAMLDTLAWAYRGLGQFSKAFDSLAEAVQICDGMAGSYRAAQVRNTLGETHRAAGDHLSARDCHDEALELAERARDRKQRARALTGLGDAHAALGDFERARDCWKRAFDEYTDMGLPAAARVEARLREVRS